jgi:hypothetical protein
MNRKRSLMEARLHQPVQIGWVRLTVIQFQIHMKITSASLQQDQFIMELNAREPKRKVALTNFWNTMV